MKKKLFLIGQILMVVLLIAAALYFIPFPVEVDMELQGAVVSADGEILEQVDITIKGEKLYYLFQEDEVQLRIETTSDDWMFPSAASGGSSYKDPYADYPYMTVYTTTGNPQTDLGWGGYALDMEDGYFLAGRWNDPSKFLIGTTGAGLEPASILDYFSDYIKAYFTAK